MAMLFVAAMQACLLLPSHRADSPAPDPARYASPEIDPALDRVSHPGLEPARTGRAARACWPTQAGPLPHRCRSATLVVMLGAYACAWARQRAPRSVRAVPRQRPRLADRDAAGGRGAW